MLIGVFAGVRWAVFYPQLGSDFKPLGDVFIKLIKMVFAPIIFATVVLGIARMENMKELGRVGVRALIYFEMLSTFALALGPGGRQRRQARRGHEHRRRAARYQGHRQLHGGAAKPTASSTSC